MNQPADLPTLSDARALAHREVDDPELRALPGPPKKERTLAAALMIVTTVCRAWHVLGLGQRGCLCNCGPGPPICRGACNP